MDPLLKQEYEQLQAFRLARETHAAACYPQGYLALRGKRVLDFTSFDFVGLAQHSAVKRAAIAAIEADGLGTASPRLSSGSRDAHANCEFKLASFFGTEAALLFSSRAQATLSLFSNFLTERDAVVFDEAAQSVVGDAAFLVHAQTYNFRVDNPQSLAVELEKSRGARRRVVFVETLSPFSGQDCNLEKILEICLRGQALLVIDESYAVGSIGIRGGGRAEALPSREGVLATISDLSLGLGGYGGAIATSRLLRDLVVSRSRMFTVEASLPPALAASNQAAIEALELMPVERAMVLERATRLRAGLKELGLTRDVLLQSPIVAIVFERRMIASEFAEALFQKGFLCDVVPRGTTLSDAASVRFVIRFSHSESIIEQLLQAISDIKARIKT